MEEDNFNKDLESITPQSEDETESPIQLLGVKTAIKRLKPGKSPVCDSIGTEM